MKLRIKGNSIRLRLTRTEVATIGEGGRVQETTLFSPQTQFIYAIEIEDRDAIEADLRDNCLTVRIPKNSASEWANTDRIGLEATHKISDNISLRLIIEKDFACLSPRGEEDSDTFDHPLTGQLKC